MSRSQESLLNRPNASIILNSLKLTQVDSSLTSNFDRVFRVQEMRLGDDLSTLILPQASGDYVYHEPNCNFYVICQGRVRLLGLDPVAGREVSALVLEVGESFDEALLAKSAWLTRAIAASDGQVAWIPASQLQSWGEKSLTCVSTCAHRP